MSFLEKQKIKDEFKSRFASNDTMISVRLQRQNVDKLQFLADDNFRSLSFVVRDAIDAYLKKNEEFFSNEYQQMTAHHRDY